MTNLYRFPTPNNLFLTVVAGFNTKEAQADLLTMFTKGAENALA